MNYKYTSRITFFGLTSLALAACGGDSSSSPITGPLEDSVPTSTPTAPPVTTPPIAVEPPVVETPVVETPPVVIQTPVVETPPAVVEPPVVVVPPVEPPPVVTPPPVVVEPPVTPPVVVEPPVTPPVVVEPPVVPPVAQVPPPPVPTGATGLTIIPATHGPIASVPFDFDDPFGTEVELVRSTPTGTGPTPPGNLRLNLLSNDWIEIDWTPSSDDGEVVEYRIYRDGEQIYAININDTHPSSGARSEIAKIWDTTSFIDCNFTRFGGVDDPLHRCADNAPQPGIEYVWTVTAVDNDGNESAPSNTLTARLYDFAGGSPVALYSDIFLDGDDLFPFATDFSRSENFIDQFSLVFAEDFNGTSLDLSNWNTALTFTDIINGEQQVFVDSSNPDNEIDYDPFNFTGESLIIEAIPLRAGDEEFLPEECAVEQTPARCQFLSGALSSHDKFGLTYGYVEGRIRTSDNTGGLSSFFLFHRFSGQDNRAHAPEIDILEYLGENPFGDEDAFQTYHYQDPLTGITKSSPTMNYENPTGALFSEDFHTYGVLWEPGLSIWYVDGVEIRRISGPQIGRQQMNIIAYLVTGSEWAPTPTGNFPVQMEIDYIRAYQRPAYICNNSRTVVESFGGDVAACQAALNP